MNRSKTSRAVALALAIAATASAGYLATTGAAQADERWRHRHWDRGDWHRHHPHYYTAPGYVYTPPPVVYAPPPVYPHPGVSLNFRF
ncbi:MAG: hypothetical protein IT563_08165 [Alphaproteobacteria bacterium]|nr:hypothetical protein [Alphaproteobacteria bacterium]